jgi:predicted O-methyltransferase YrrM
MNARSGYVSGMRRARTVADRIGLLDRLSRSNTRRAQYLRSMFAVAGQPAVRSNRRGHEHLDFTPYVAMVEQIGGTFDLIVVDGRARVASVAAAVPHLADDGVLVFDNANRAEYRSGIAGSGLHAEFMRGLAPSLPYPSTTALLTRKETVRP